MAKRDKETIAKARSAYNYYAENIRKSEQLRASINKGIAAGQDVTELLLMALECIALMTNEPFFYRQNKDELMREREDKRMKRKVYQLGKSINEKIDDIFEEIKAIEYTYNIESNEISLDYFDKILESLQSKCCNIMKSDELRQLRILDWDQADWIEFKLDRLECNIDFFKDRLDLAFEGQNALINERSVFNEVEIKDKK